MPDDVLVTGGIELSSDVTDAIFIIEKMQLSLTIKVLRQRL